VLQLPRLELGPDPEADYLYFAAVLHRDVASRYLALAAPAGSTAEAR
jgi:hypothetical protein